MAEFGLSWAWVTGDTILNEGETILHCLVVNASVSGGAVTIYEGLDAVSGRKVGIFQALANVTNLISLCGIQLDRGLFVDVGANVTGVLVVYSPVRLD